MRPKYNHANSHINYPRKKERDVKKTTGKTIASGFIVNRVGDKDGNDVLARRIDAAIKRAVKEAFRAGQEYQEVENEAASHQAKINIQTKYGVKL